MTKISEENKEMTEKEKEKYIDEFGKFFNACNKDKTKCNENKATCNEDKTTCNEDKTSEASCEWETYQWQKRFLKYILDKRGKWPKVIDAPTAAGKTVAVEIHLFVNYLAAEGVPLANTPRRMIASVNRRAVTDKQYKKALAIQEKMANALASQEKMTNALKEEEDILVKVANALFDRANKSRDEVENDKPFDVVRIRGGLGRDGIDRSWRIHPTRVSIICMTPAMFGSRLLFRGYGTSPITRPVEAGLLAYDTVLFLDEAHLNRQLGMTANQIWRIEKEICQSEELQKDLDLENKIMPFKIMPLQVCVASATLDEESQSDNNSNGIIRVKKEDFNKDKELEERLTCPKPVSVDFGRPELDKDENEQKDKKGKTKLDFVKSGDLISKAIKMHEKFGGPVACIFNTPKAACNFEESLKKELFKEQKKEYSTRCIVGKMRHFEGNKIRETLCNPKEFNEIDFIVATQTIELGIDVSFSCMLTELASISALSQRAGRVKREGGSKDNKEQDNKEQDNKEQDNKEQELPLIYVWENEKTNKCEVYSEDQLEFARKWVNKRAEKKEGLSAWACFNWKDDFKNEKNKIKVIQDAEMRGRKCFERLEFVDAEYFSSTSEELACETNVLTGKKSDLKLWLDDSFNNTAEVYFVVRKWPQYKDKSRKLCDIEESGMQKLLEVLKPLEEEMVPCSIGTARKIVGHLRKLANEDEVQVPFLIQSNDKKPKQFSRGEQKNDSQDKQENVLTENGIAPGNVIVVSETAEIFLNEIAYYGEEEDDPFKDNKTKDSVYCKVAKSVNEKNPKSFAFIPFLFEPSDSAFEDSDEMGKVFEYVNNYIDNGDSKFSNGKEDFIDLLLEKLLESAKEANIVNEKDVVKETGDDAEAETKNDFKKILKQIELHKNTVENNGGTISYAISMLLSALALKIAFDSNNGSGRWEVFRWEEKAQQGFCITYKPNRPDFAYNEEKKTYEIPSLEDHENAVAKRVEDLSKTLGLLDELCDVLKIAAQNHDEGKRAFCFQSYLKETLKTLGGKTYDKYSDGAIVIAKGTFENLKPSEKKEFRVCAHLPKNWRHEQLSALMYWQSCAGNGTNSKDKNSNETSLDHELITRLIGTTHGRGRTMFEHNSDMLLKADINTENKNESEEYESLRKCAEELFDQGLWDEIVTSTNEKYGFWFVSYLEAILRAADGQVSSEGN